MKFFFIFCILSLSLIITSNHEAFAISVLSNYTYTGSAGDYLLNFSFTNNIPAGYNQHIDAVAVDLPGDPLAGSPFSPYWVHAPDGVVLNNAAQGGSDIHYPNSWVAAWGYDLNTNILTPGNDIPSGHSLSGFFVHIDQIPSIIHFTVFTNDYLCSQCGSDRVISAGLGYFGDDAFLKGHVSGFEGIATGPQGAVPEPATVSLLTLGLSGLLVRRKRIVAPSLDTSQGRHDLTKL